VPNIFYVKYELRLKKELSAKCFLCGVRAEAEETLSVEHFLRGVRAEAVEKVDLGHVIQSGTTRSQ